MAASIRKDFAGQWDIPWTSRLLEDWDTTGVISYIMDLCGQIRLIENHSNILYIQAVGRSGSSDIK